MDASTILKATGIRIVEPKTSKVKSSPQVKKQQPKKSTYNLPDKLESMGYEDTEYSKLVSHEWNKKRVESEIKLLDQTEMELKIKIKRSLERSDSKIQEGINEELFKEVILLGFNEDEALIIATNEEEFDKLVDDINEYLKINNRIRSLIEKHINECNGKSDKEIKKENRSNKREINKHKKKKPKGKKKRRESKTRIKILGSLYGETEGKDIGHIEKKSGINERNIREGLKYFMELDFVRRERKGKRYYYYLTMAGRWYVEDYFRMLWQYVIPQSGKSIAHCHNIRQNQIIGVLDQAISITHYLLKKGWYHRNVKTTLKNHNTSYLIKTINIIDNKDRIDNKGAYLYTIFIKKTPDSIRINALKNNVLSDLPIHIIDTYKKEAASMTSREYVHFAYSLRKRSRKNLDFTIGDVAGIANWVRKKSKKDRAFWRIVRG